ncbi:MAG TPA: hypothetical protein VN765_17210 [Candidatus Acidoferrum sp.]|nr:hypothetical protein [Candidatus Acidoferrum sp.]
MKTRNRATKTGHGKTSLCLTFGIMASLVASAKTEVSLFYNHTFPPVEFAARDIAKALEAKGNSAILKNLETAAPAAGTSIIVASSAEEARRIAGKLGLAPVKSGASQSYALRRKVSAGQTNYVVLGADAAGAMYGGLDLAEAIRLGTLTALPDSDHTPWVARRGIKFNITMDRRSPAYWDNNSDSAQLNIPEMWNLQFWHDYLDEMARNRFNVLSLWSLHPFPSMVKVPEYPEVALNDVWGQQDGRIDYDFNMDSHDMAKPFHLENVKIVKKMTMDDKIKFWREVMQYAKDRGVDIYLFTWNIFVWGTEGKYGLTEDGNNTNTIPYFRASVRETVRTYPLLAGIGITAGEHMLSSQGPFDHEAWLWQTYGEGIRDALKDQPGRQFRLIHRFHETGQNKILAAFKDYPGPFDFSFKYSVAHMYSLAKPTFINPLLTGMTPAMRTWLTVRNDDIFTYRWGDPDFAREYVSNMPGPDRLAGFYMGPDGYCWGREFMDREPESPRQLVMQKQWYSFMLWGRLSYEPQLPNALFENTLAARFPQVPAAKLFLATACASRIIPQTTRFFWHDLDFQWFPEACLQKSGFFTVRDFAMDTAMPGSGILNIRQWRARLAKNAAMDGITPLQVAANLKDNAAKALALVAEMRPAQGANKELRLTLGDYEAMAHLGNYYAEKILGACDLSLFDQDGKTETQAAAVAHLEAALDHWKKYAAVAASQYQPQRLGRLSQVVDLVKLTPKAQADIGIGQSWRPHTLNGDGEGAYQGAVNFRP